MFCHKCSATLDMSSTAKDNADSGWCPTCRELVPIASSRMQPAWVLGAIVVLVAVVLL